MYVYTTSISTVVHIRKLKLLTPKTPPISN